VEPPDVNRGEYPFSVDAKGSIVYGLGAIKGLGEGPIESIIEARQGGRVFTDLFDFCARTEPRKVNKRALEALIRAGAFDSLGTARSVLQSALADAVRAAEQSAHNASSGIDDLFGEVVAAPSGDVYAGHRGALPWTTRERLKGEKDTLGLYVSGHPVDDYLDELRQYASDRISELRADGGSQAVAGLVVSHRIMKTRRGDDMGVLVLDDRSGRIEVTLFSEELAEFRRQLADDMIVVCDGVVAQDDREGGLKMRANRVRSLAQTRRDRIRAIVLALQPDDFGGDFAARLRQLLALDAAAGCPLWVDYRGRGARGRIALGEAWRLDPSDDCLTRLRQSFGAERILVEYGPDVPPPVPRQFAKRAASWS